MKTVVNAECLDFISRKKKDDPSVTYNSLICYEPGKDFPELLRMNVREDRVANAKGLVGKTVTIEADVTIYQNKASLHFIQGKAL